VSCSPARKPYRCTSQQQNTCTLLTAGYISLFTNPAPILSVRPLNRLVAQGFVWGHTREVENPLVGLSGQPVKLCCPWLAQREDELFVFGGELFDGSKTRVYSDFYRYQCKSNQWTHVQANGSGPPPRSAHQVHVESRTQCTPSGLISLNQSGFDFKPSNEALNPVNRLIARLPRVHPAAQAWVHRGFYYIFGGEFTSPNQERFHHYKDLWRCELATNQVRGPLPSRFSPPVFSPCVVGSIG
jgi:hypothetical protein